jgi:hypothetical protein
MTSRERLRAAVNHAPTDRICVDFGACGVTGMAASAVHRLRQAIFPDPDYRIKVIEPYQMLGEIDEELRLALGIDVAGIYSPRNMFGFANRGWKPFTMPNGLEVLVPEEFNVTRDDKGNTYMYPEGDISIPPCAKMPRSGFFFGALERQQPLDESKLNPLDNCEEFELLSDEDLSYYAQKAKHLYKTTDCGLFLSFGGLGFGDIALVPALWLKHPRGIRGVEEWYVSLALRKDYIKRVFERQCEIGLRNIERMAEAVGDYVDVVFVTGADFGMQSGLLTSVDSYRELFMPFHIQINQKIHSLTNWKVFIHSCGSVYKLLPEFIDAGFNIFNPVQCSAKDMEPRRLKKEFGNDLVFWGGGVDTQKTLPFGSPDEVYREVRDRIDIFAQDSGFVFNSIHNIQANVPAENILAMFQAIQDSYKI